MKIKILLKKIFLIFILTGFVVFVVLLSNITHKKIETSGELSKIISSSFYAQAKNITPLPVHIKIPKLSIDATIEDVGITPDGAMDVPSGPSDVAWFDLGPRPGEIGSSVIDGHSGYKDNQPAVFDNLGKLQKGDNIYVEDADGTILTFVVQGFRSYGQHENARDVFSSNNGIAHLNLITCSGTWNDIEKTHSNRLVVFTDKINS